ncbi:MAG TPA: hypothetical protein VNW29_07450 [Candidatus Sulfotelmatobacter sp.]|jgi:hypothetical protein|nr:hypothetical protein [Candidatus Sulfotelmatobacter sp.]
MNKSIKDILIEILTIAGYPNNKNNFIVEFEKLNLLEAMMHIYDSLPLEKQLQIKEYSNDPYAIKKIIPQEIYVNELKKITRHALQDCVKDFAPALNPYQKEKIAKLVFSY